MTNGFNKSNIIVDIRVEHFTLYFKTRTKKVVLTLQIKLNVLIKATMAFILKVR